MKVAKNFDIREFVPRAIWNRWGKRSIWFIAAWMPQLAQAYKDFFTDYFKKLDPNVSHVIIKINDWHFGGKKQYSGFRPGDVNIGAALSQHKLANAFDCEIIIVYKDGTRKEADYSLIHVLIKDNFQYFRKYGLTTIEALKDAKGWLHSDGRNTGLNKLLIVNA